MRVADMFVVDILVLFSFGAVNVVEALTEPQVMPNRTFIALSTLALIAERLLVLTSRAFIVEAFKRIPAFTVAADNVDAVRTFVTFIESHKILLPTRKSLEIDALTADKLMVLINMLLEMLLLSNVVMFPVTESMS